MKKSKTLFFAHDYNARNDPKLRILRGQHGSVGMDFYWCLIETLHEQGGTANALCIRAIAADLGKTMPEAQKIIDTMVEVDLVSRAGNGDVTCARVVRSLEKLNAYIAEQSENGRRSAEARKRNAGSTVVQPPLNAGSTDRSTDKILDKTSSNTNNNTHTEGVSVQTAPLTRAEEVEAAREKVANRNKPTWEALDAYAQMRGYAPKLTQDYWDWMEGKRWMVGAAPGTPIGKWRSHFDSHIRMKLEKQGQQ